MAAARYVEESGRFRVAGVTSFPCFLFDPERGEVAPTPNLDTVLAAAATLRRHGFQIEQVNAPRNTCVSLLPRLAEAGVTHGEPGHALTGTTPLHAHRDEPEQPALVYVSEVTHRDRDRVYTLGGGFYARGGAETAVVASRPDEVSDPAHRLIVEQLPAESIDYYGHLRETAASRHVAHVGDTAVYAFRTQIFVTRANLAVVAGLTSGQPRLLGVWRRGFQPW